MIEPEVVSVWIVTTTDGEFTNIHGVFSTKELALAYKDEVEGKDKNSAYYTYRIGKHYIDDGLK